MAMLDKIFFWRRKEPELPPEGLGHETGFGEGAELGLGKDEFGFPGEEPVASGLTPSAMPRQPGFPEEPASMPGMRQAYPSMPSQPPSIEKDLELISAKLDALKAVLDSMNQRLANLERIARESNEVY